MQEQIYFKRMPPEKKKQPDEVERKELLAAMSTELKRHQASKLEGKLQKPEFGNYVDHDKLFSGAFKHLPGFTYDRRWLISEYIFHAKFQRMLKGKATAKWKGRKVPVAGNRRFRDFSLTNPFLLPDRSGVRYYAHTDLTGGHLASMLTNAKKTSEYITDYLVKRNKTYLPAIKQIMALEDAHEATLAARRDFLNHHIARYCEIVYGDRNKGLLPDFVPVKLKEPEPLEEGETYKKAPKHVAHNMLKSLGGQETVYQALRNPERAKLSDEAFRELCERTWFYWGDHERKIQGRMTILRDYMPEMRDHVTQNERKIKPLVYEPLGEAEMEVIKTSILRHRRKGDFYNQVIEKCM
ncbi:MAG: hypothetical protein AAF492_31490, partial [Verrucomicrobiota bacterium]